MTQPIDIGPLPTDAEVANYLYANLAAEDRHQDLLTVELPTGYCIYVGWFPEYDPSGEYWVRAAWATGELPPLKTRSLQAVQLRVMELIDRYSRNVVSHTTSKSISVPEFTLP